MTNITKRTTEALAVAALVDSVAAVGISGLPGAAAQDATVSPGESVQAAVDSATAGDTILVEAGT